MGPLDRTPLELAIVAMAERQGGLLRRVDLLALGLGAQAIAYRVRTGRLHVVFPGVYALGHRCLSRQARFQAAVWWCGDGAALSHDSAAEFHGWLGADGRPVHVSTTRAVASITGRVVVHRTRHLDHRDVLVHAGLAVTDRVRTIIDLADEKPYDELRRIADALPVLPVAALAAKQARLPGRRGAPRVTALIRSEDARTRSELERRFVRYCTRHGLPHPSARNARIAGHRADCVYAHERLVVELDSRAHHSRRAEMAADRDRDADYLLAGWGSVRLVWEDLDPARDRKAELLRRLLARGV